MKIKDFAEQLLFGKTLSEKLMSANNLDFDLNYEKLKVMPDFPGRPYDLSLQNKESISIKFPSLQELENDKTRGFVMHFFANHELLAIELMAIAILKFPDAPLPFLKGLIKTIGEEQKHMCLYRQRMDEVGVEFGELSVNSYFWDSMKEMQSPLDFVVQMCLTFEQANLDFSWQYKLLFDQMGDKKSSSVMEEVFQDEVGHVGLGVHWFQKWKRQDESEWEAYVRLLPYPLTPARGKGKVFYDFVRDKTGLSVEFVEKMRLFSHSKGRVPFIFHYNPDCEKECSVVGNYTPSQVSLQIKKDLSFLVSFLCVESDVVVLPKQASAEFLKYWQELGLGLPQYIVSDSIEQALMQLKDRKIRGLMPWGWTQSLAELEGTVVKLIPDKTYAPVCNINSFHSKQKSSEFYQKWMIQKGRDLLLYICHTELEIFAAIESIRSKGIKRILFKSSLGVAGVGNVRYFEEELSENQRNWIKDTLRTEVVVVEPWYERVCDFSLLFDIRDQKIKFQGITRLLNTYQGQYRGTCIGKIGNSFSEEIARMIYQGSEHMTLYDEMLSFGQLACSDYMKDGYQGPLSIDGYFYETSHGVDIYHCAEINSRFSMGRVAFEVARQFVSKQFCFHMFVISKKQIKKMGYNSFSAFSEKVKLRCEGATLDKRWSEGLYFLTDPNDCVSHCVVGVVSTYFYENIEKYWASLD